MFAMIAKEIEKKRLPQKKRSDMEWNMSIYIQMSAKAEGIVKKTVNVLVR